MKAPKEFPVLFSKNEIAEMVSRVASEIEADCRDDDELVFVGVLKGAWVFHAALVQCVSRPNQIDFLRASSYGDSMESSRSVKITKDLELDVKGKIVFLVEDIIDTGRTLLELKQHVLSKGAKEVKLVALLDKKSKREVDLDADYVGTEIPDRFVVGFGLDWGERYRSIPEIHYVPEEVASSGQQP